MKGNKICVDIGGTFIVPTTQTVLKNIFWDRWSQSHLGIQLMLKEKAIPVTTTARTWNLGGGSGVQCLSTRYCRMGAYKKRITNPFFNLSYTTTTLLASPHQKPSCWFTMVRILDMVLGARASLDISSKSAARSGSLCRQPCSAPGQGGGLTQPDPRGPRTRGTGRGCGWAQSWRSPEHSGSDEMVEVTGSFPGAPLSLDKMMTGKL